MNAQPDAISAPTPDEIRASVTLPRGRKLLMALTIAGVASVGLAAYAFNGSKEQATSYVTRDAARGDIVSTATATGNLEPRATVTIGSEISGLIKSVEVEDSAVVEKGQLLATFDTTDLNGQLSLEKASLSSSNASVRRAQASYDEAVAELARTRGLVERGVTARADLDAAETAKVRAKADLDAARANAQRSKASVTDVNTNLGKTEIRSPIAGVILERNVEPGQTVASSLQAPELFVVAEDLSRMNLEIWIDEADIGVVKAGQPAKFEVSAYPNRKFDAVVESLDISPTTTDNVVTYKAVLTVDNSGELLRPGMTASATITTQLQENVLRVPNAALRFDPNAATKQESGPSFSLVPTRPTRSRGYRSSNNEETQRGAMGKVYVQRGAELAMIRVQTGNTDGLFTEITGGELKDGDKVVVGIGTPDQDGAESAKGANRAERGAK